MKKVIAIGDNCIDDYVRQSKKYAGGCSVNFSIYMAQFGVSSSYMGAVGTDDNGKIILDTLSGHGVDISQVHVMNGKTAVTEVELINHDRKFLSYEKGVMEDFSLNDDDISYICGFDMVHTSVYGEIDHYLPKFSRKVKIGYDFGDKLEYNARNDILHLIDYAFFSYKQDDSYIRSYLEDAYSYGLRCVIATLGENGSIAYDGSNFYREGIHKVETVDTIGAGDSFIAGFLFGMLENRKVEECLAMGAARAEQTIQHFGAI
ncbi:MAG: fructoselysine 6-kinase [Clostridiales bacterium]|nr:fructoselysine 6-kinase [Clostridiales bacterium]